MSPNQIEYKPTASPIETRKSSKVTKDVNSAINKMQKIVRSIKIHATEHDTGYKLPALTTNHDTTKDTNCRALSYAPSYPRSYAQFYDHIQRNFSRYDHETRLNLVFV